MSTPEDYFDVNAEPNRFEGAFCPDPTEQRIPMIDGHEDEISTVRDSVLNEPAFTGKLQQAELGAWLAQKRAQCTTAGSIGVTLAAALVAGPFAVIGALMTGRQTVFGILCTVLFAPIIEELLKQSGMIYVLEKKPYRIFSAWQFVVAAVISAAIFATVENLLYIHVYVKPEVVGNFAAFCRFRWTVCTLLHVTCAVIASMGLMRVWKKQLNDGRAADLGVGFWYFASAMTVHGLYNLTMTFFPPHF